MSHGVLAAGVRLRLPEHGRGRDGGVGRELLHRNPWGGNNGRFTDERPTADLS